MVLDKAALWLVSHKEGRASQTTLEKYCNFVIGCYKEGECPTDNWTLCTTEDEAGQLAHKYTCINQLHAKLATMSQEDIDQVVRILKA